VFGQKFPGEKGNVKGCVVMKQCPVLSSPKFGAKLSHIFKQSPQNVTVVCEIGCLGFQDEIFVNNSLAVKKMMIMCLTLLFTCLSFFGLSEFGHAIPTPVYGSFYHPRTLV
jgi:hypothetical protein